MIGSSDSPGWFASLKNRLIDTVADPKTLGGVPTLRSDQSKVFYVLGSPSFANSAMLQNCVRRYGMPEVFEGVSLGPKHFKNRLISLKPSDKGSYAQTPKLFDVVTAALENDEEILFIPVSVIWGRGHKTDDSLIRLLTAGGWEKTTATGDLFNVLTKGNDTYVELSDPVRLSVLCTDAEQCRPGTPLVGVIENQLAERIRALTERVIGPDLSDRRNEADKLIESPAMSRIIDEVALAQNKKQALIKQEAYEMFQQIATDYNITVIRAFEIALNKLWDQLFYGVNVHHFEHLKNLGDDVELVYMPSHRSHLDYLLVLFVVFRRGFRTPYVAAGDNLNAPILGPILRRGGAFFLRRSFGGDPLYTGVFREYVYSILTRGVPLKLFPEGGRSRSGFLLPPRTGLLSMIVHASLRASTKPIAFVPVYISYERTMEGLSYLSELRGKAKKRESIFSVIKTLKNVERVFGQVNVNFGEPMLAADYYERFEVSGTCIDPNRSDQALPPSAVNAVNAIAAQNMININRSAVIAPVNLVASALVHSNDQSIGCDLAHRYVDWTRQCLTQLPYDSSVVVTQISAKAVFEYTLGLGLVTLTPDKAQYALTPDQRDLVSYAVNNTAHLLATPSLIMLLLESAQTLEQITEQMDLFIEQTRDELFLKYTVADTPKLAQSYVERFTKEELVTQNGELYELSPAEQPLSELISSISRDCVRRRIAYLLVISQSPMSLDDAAKCFFSLSQGASSQSSFSHSNWLDQSLFKNYARQLINSTLISLNDDKQLSLSTEGESIFARLSDMVSTAEFQSLQTVYGASPSDGKENGSDAP